MLRILLIAIIGSSLNMNCAFSEEAAKTKQPTPEIAEEEYRNTNFATLIISDVAIPGRRSLTIEFRHEDTVVRSTVHHDHNAPTGDSSERGNFYPVYLVMTGEKHRIPNTFRTVESLINSDFFKEKIEIEGDKTLPRKNQNASEPSTRVLRLRYGFQYPMR